MILHDYPGRHKHIEEHNSFCKWMTENREEFHKGENNLGVGVLQFLNIWLTDHILKTDAEYGRFVNESESVAVIA
jgi:hemerythrin-like metal-binding protein